MDPSSRRSGPAPRPPSLARLRPGRQRAQKRLEPGPTRDTTLAPRSRYAMGGPLSPNPELPPGPPGAPGKGWSPLPGRHEPQNCGLRSRAASVSMATRGAPSSWPPREFCRLPAGRLPESVSKGEGFFPRNLGASTHRCLLGGSVAVPQFLRKCPRVTIPPAPPSKPDPPVSPSLSWLRSWLPALSHLIVPPSCTDTNYSKT